MNRQIIFRSKCLDNGEWVYGDLQLGDGNHIPMIGVVRGGHDPNYYQVEEATIGQFAGLRDKDSRPIYEGDIVMQRGYSGVKPMVARANTGRRGIGIELMQEYYDIAVKRVKDAQAQPKLNL